jgi:predicted peroxiredoxin
MKILRKCLDRTLVLSLLLLPLASAAQPGQAAQSERHGGDRQPDRLSNGHVILFLTQTDSIKAGHALHMAGQLLKHGRQVAVVLTGEAGQLAVAEGPAQPSAYEEQSLQEILSELMGDGASVHLSPLSRSVLEEQGPSISEGVTHPKTDGPMHERLVDPATQVMVW